MSKIYFATGNRGKVLTLQKYLKNYEVALEVEQVDLELVEPQADTATEVALAKARQAYDQLHKPVVVDDSSFHITALRGFPGPYIKYMLTTVGADGILDFMSRHDDRSAYFLSTLVYMDESCKEHVFEDEPYFGTIARSLVNIDRETSWSDLYKIFIPKGATKTLVELNDEEKSSLATKNDSYAAFVRFMKAS